ncbi:uncharacterized protein ISCGN_009574 [Ixodes scapularis]
MASVRTFSRLRFCLIFVTLLKLRLDNFTGLEAHERFRHLLTRPQTFPPLSSWVAVGATTPLRPNRPGFSPDRCRSSAAGFTTHAHRHHIVWCLLLAGDIAPNPGPQQTTCACCTKRVRDNQAALCCDTCEGWFHRGCVHMSLGQYRRLGSCSDPWVCMVCSLPQFSDDYFDVPASVVSRTDASSSAVLFPDSLAGGGVSGVRAPLCGRSVRCVGGRPGAGGTLRKSLNLWYTNCRSLKNKVQDFQSIVSSLPDNTIFLLTETWLDASVHDGELLGTAHAIYRRDRGGRGGGVLVAAPTGFTVDRRHDLEHPHLEAIFPDLYTPQGIVLLGCVYCPPSTRDAAYKLLDASLTCALLKPYRDVLIIGDFNSHIDWWSHDEPFPGDAIDDFLLDTTSSAGRLQVCHSPTYLPRSSFLDLVFTTDITKVLSCDVYPSLSGSDHMAVEVSFATSLPRKGHFARTTWRFHETDHSHLANLAHLAPWCMTTAGSDCLSDFDLWCDFASAIQRESIPHSLRSTRRKRAPWITHEIIKAASQKRALFKKAARLQCAETLRAAKDLQRTLKAAIHTSHISYARNVALKAREDPKLFWSYMSRLQTSSNKPTFVNNVPLTSPRDIAQSFAQHFAGVFNAAEPTPDIDRLVQNIEENTPCPSLLMPDITLSSQGLVYTAPCYVG